MQAIVIPPVTPDDLETLQTLSRETFYEAFAKDNNEADMQKYLEESFNSEKLTVDLNDPASFFFIAWDNNDPVGYLKLNTGDAQTELKDDDTSVEIERIYVKSAYQGKKIGQLLYDKAEEIGREQKRKYIWLAVWEHNLKAMAFYKKNGFEKFGEHIFKLGDDEQTDIMMRKEL